MHRLFNLFVLVTIFVVNVAHAEMPQTFKEIVEKTVASNPQVQAKLHEYTASLQQQKVAKSNYYPSADIIYTARTQQQVISNVGNIQTPDSQAQLVISQMIFDGLATPSQVNRLSYTARVRYYELQAAMQTTALAITRAYVDVQRALKLVEYAEDNYVRHKQIFDHIKDRVNAGVTLKADLEQVSGRLALAEANLLTETTNLQNVSARFQNLYGELPPVNLAEVQFLEDADLLDANRALETAYSKSPAFLASAENILATEQEVRGNRAGYLPQVNLTGKTNPYTSTNGQNSSLAADTLELTASFNLFRGFKDQSQVAQAAENLNKSFDLRDQACRTVRQEVSIAQNDVVILKAQINYRNVHQLSIEKARAAYRKQFDHGQRTALDLLDTENEYFQARRNYTNAVNDLNNAYARTYAGQGVLLGKIGVQRADLPEIGQSEDNQNYAICSGVPAETMAVDKQALLARANLLVAAEAKPVITPAPEKIILSDKVKPPVEFETSSAVLKSSSYPVLDNALMVLKEWGDAKVEVAGHTDRRNTSKAAFNLKLSKKRAQSVANYLIKNGIAKDRLIINGYGYNQPIAENDPISGNIENRRVELIRLK
ncbi:MAG: TolC family outer membrane protein [Methylophilaceae bacterium]|nr:TolC family outer membrane protein [Methylophilaceae bacterium]